MPANPSYAQGFNGLKNTGAIMDVFATTVKESLYAKTFLPQITESGYLGQIKSKGQTVTIATVPRVKTFAYSRGMTLPINCESEPSLELKVDRAMAWTQFWDRLDQHQTHLKMLQPETISGATSQIAENMEKEFLSDVATFAHAKNVGATAGIQSGAYNLGTAAAPVGVKADTLIPYLTQFFSVIAEHNVSETEGPKSVLIPEMFRWYLVNSDQLSDASKIGGPSSLKTNKVTSIGGVDIYTSTLLTPTVVNGHNAFPIFACSKKAMNFVVALNEVKTVEPSTMMGTLAKGVVLYDWGNVRPEGVALGYAYGADTTLITGS